MRDVFATAARWLREERRFSLATLAALRDAAPAPLGTTIAVDDTGRIVGNIGAGCYESAIVEACMHTATDGRSRALAINLESDDALIGGTACGAVMDVVLWRPGAKFLGDACAIAEGTRDVAMTIGYEVGGVRRVFEHVWKAREPLILVGATSLAAEIARMARHLDFRIVVLDPRSAFATRERIPGADEIVLQWPEEYLPDALSPTTSVIVLSHDPKFDLPALRCALASPAPFVGLLGSRRAQAARRAQLRSEGVDETALARIHGPVGLDIGGVTTAETALSILAEAIAVRRHRSGEPLIASNGAIHERKEPATADPYDGVGPA